MINKQISIIIPTYNMEKYIGKCLDSLLIPEFDRVEVLVVNDGSKDRSSEIAHSYADRYPGSIRVIDKANGNYGSCINTALPMCTGRYVKVLDADDTFDTGAFSVYVKALSMRDEDVVVNDYAMVYDDKPDSPRPTFRQLGYEAEKTYSFEDVYRYISADLHMHCVAYKLGNILAMNYRQTEGVSYTDNEWIFAPIGIADSFAFVDCGYLYRYLLGRGGQTVDPAMSLARIHEHFDVIKAQAAFWAQGRVIGRRKQYLETQLLGHALFVYSMVIKGGNKDSHARLADFDRQIKADYPGLYGLLDEVVYAPRVPYKYIKKYRESGCSPEFGIPSIVKIADRAICFAAKVKNIVFGN